MPKFYVKSNKCKLLLDAKTPFAAALTSVSTWKRLKSKMDVSIRVSEVGFDADSDHPHHVLDIIFPTTYIKAKLKS